MIKEKRKKQNLMSYKIIIKKRAQKALDEIEDLRLYDGAKDDTDEALLLKQ